MEQSGSNQILQMCHLMCNVTIEFDLFSFGLRLCFHLQLGGGYLRGYKCWFLSHSCSKAVTVGGLNVPLYGFSMFYCSSSHLKLPEMW